MNLSIVSMKPSAIPQFPFCRLHAELSVCRAMPPRRFGQANEEAAIRDFSAAQGAVSLPTLLTGVGPCHHERRYNQTSSADRQFQVWSCISKHRTSSLVPEALPQFGCTTYRWYMSTLASELAALGSRSGLQSD